MKNKTKFLRKDYRVIQESDGHFWIYYKDRKRPIAVATKKYRVNELILEHLKNKKSCLF